MSSSLQEQLLKAGLVKKDKAQKLAQQQSKSKRKQSGKPAAAKLSAADARRAERDRALAAERNARARARELEHQLRQLVDAHKLERKGSLPYAFTEGGSVKRIYVDEAQRTQLSAGALVVVRVGTRLELVPRVAAERVRERAPEAIVLDHAAAPAETSSAAAEGYEGYEVPDDLVW
jgi:uncharacterized protein